MAPGEQQEEVKEMKLRFLQFSVNGQQENVSGAWAAPCTSASMDTLTWPKEGETEVETGTSPRSSPSGKCRVATQAQSGGPGKVWETVQVWRLLTE